MEDEMKKLREHIRRNVTHLAREHGVKDDVVWRLMLEEATKTNYYTPP